MAHIHTFRKKFHELMLLVPVLWLSSCAWVLEEDQYINEVVVMDKMYIAQERTEELPGLWLRESEESSAGCATNLLAVAVDSLAGRVYVCSQLNESLVKFEALWATAIGEVAFCDSKTLTREGFIRVWQAATSKKVLVDTMRLSKHGLPL